MEQNYDSNKTGDYYWPNSQPDATDKILKPDELLEQEVNLASLPPGGGTPAIPYIQEFSAFINALSKVYRNADQGYQASREDARRMRNSLTIMEPLKSRFMATAHLSWHIEMPDAHDEEQQDIAKDLTRIIDDIPDFLQMKMWLLEAVWAGRSGVQLKYKWDWSQGKKRLVVGGWEPVHPDSLIFKWDRDEVGVLVIPYSYGEGTKDFNLQDTIPTDVARAKVLTPWERKMFIINKSNIEAGDFFDPDRSGAKHGLGLRHYLFYPWRLMTDTLGMLHEFVERIALGWTLFRFQAGNPQDESAVNKAATDLSFNNVAIIPGRPEQKWKDVERLDTQPAGVDLLLKVINDYYGGQIRKLIIGQSGMGDAIAQQNSKNAEFSQDAFRRIVMYDSSVLAETMSRDMLDVLMEYNFPACPYRPKFKFNLDRRDPEEYMRSVRAFFDIGGTLDEDSVRGHLGLEKPTEDSPVLRRTLNTMEQGEEFGQSVGDQVEGKGKKGKDGKEVNHVTKIDAIRAVIDELGPTAKFADISSHLEGQGIKASRSMIYNTIAQIRGSSNFKKAK